MNERTKLTKIVLIIFGITSVVGLLIIGLSKEPVSHLFLVLFGSILFLEILLFIYSFLYKRSKSYIFEKMYQYGESISDNFKVEIKTKKNTYTLSRNKENDVIVFEMEKIKK